MRLSRVTAPLSCLCMLACATTSSPPVPAGPPPDWKLASASMSTGNTFQAVGGSGGQISVEITGHDLYGPSFNLSVGKTYIRGQVGGASTVDVNIKGDRGDGSVKSMPFSCIVTTNPDGSAHVTGAMGAGNTDFIITPKEITGRIGVVVYSLGWNGTRYEGSTVPGGAAWLMLPAVMATWSNVEAACTLAVLLIG